MSFSSRTPLTHRGRGSALGLQVGRLRGGFTATSLPGIRPTSTPATEVRPTETSRESTPSTPPLRHTTFQVDNGEDLVGALNSIMNTMKKVQDQVTRVERKVVGLEQQQSKISDALKELTALVQKQMKDSFCIKGSSLESPLRAEVAKLFCGSLTRNPPESDVHAAIVRVMGRVDSREKNKVEVALKYCKAKLTEFRTEERRKVLGHKPYNRTCFLTTRELAQQIMRQMHTPDDIDEELYIKHLALLRKFVKVCHEEAEVKYSVFREWLGDSVQISEEMWSAVMEEDDAFDYQSNGSGLGTRVSVDEVEVYTSEQSPSGSLDHGGILSANIGDGDEVNDDMD